MIRKFWLITISYSLCILVATAQIPMLDTLSFQGRVKLMSQFIHRFNGEEFHPFIKADDKDAQRKNLCQLFNIQDITKQSLESSAFELIDSIIAHDLKFYYEDPRWYAQATCVGTLKNKPVKFDIILVKEKNKKGYYKWAISNVIGDIFLLVPSRKTEKIYLYPDDHEIRFMNLHQITTEKDDYITYYGSDKHQIDPVSVFFTMIYTGLLNIDYVSELEFICHQVPGYSFTIHEFEEESSNTGWLISHWEKTNENQKHAQLNIAYNNHFDAIWEEYEKTKIKNVPKATMSNEMACRLVEEFCKALNDYLCTPDSTHLERLSTFIKGKDSSRWLKLINTKKGFKLKDDEKFKDFLESLADGINQIFLNDIHVVDNSDFEEYLKKYIPVSSQFQIHFKEDITLDFEIIIFIDEKISGIKLPHNC